MIEAGRTGLLVPPDDPAALSAALEAMIVAPARRHELATAGARHVRRKFAMGAGIERLMARFRPQTTPLKAAG